MYRGMSYGSEVSEDERIIEKACIACESSGGSLGYQQENMKA